MVNIQDIKQRFGIIGHSPLLIRALEKSCIVASTDISVLVSGKSGTGKEVIPKIIHFLSKRKNKPYIAVNCGAIPEGTIESELFGHEKGSFTGALGARKGYFEVADGGTIFLDEVGELPLVTQVRLLRVLETGEFMKVGSSQSQKTNVRIVAATNKNLLKEIEKGNFREDLYYRLNTVEINLPPLNERKADIILIFKKFISDFASKYSVPPIKLSEDAINILENYSWKGNIRELRNICEQISVLEAGEIVDQKKILSYLPNYHNFGQYLPSISKKIDEENYDEILEEIDFLKDEIGKIKIALKTILKKDLKNKEDNLNEIETNFSIKEIPMLLAEHIEEDDKNTLSLKDSELEKIKRSLDKYSYNKKEAAEALGISERTLYRKIKQYGLGE